MTISSFRDSDAKKLVREHWDTPLLRYLHEQHGARYRYMGFPGTDLADVKLWADMIEEVIAFELVARGRRQDERAWVKQLRTNLRTLGIPGVVYFGSFEEVVILRKDYDGQEYKQDKVITLYNLDFCDEIASQIETRELGRRVWRFKALRVILQDQRECYRQFDGPSWFIILLTVRNQINADRIRAFLTEQNLLADTQRYYQTGQTSHPIPSTGPLIGTHAWALKAFLYNTLRGYFVSRNISALFFPFVKYTGTPVGLPRGKSLKSPMLHWVLLCRFGDLDVPNPRFLPIDFLTSVVSIEAEPPNLAPAPEPGEQDNPQSCLSCVDWLRQYEDHFFTNGRGT